MKRIVQIKEPIKIRLKQLANGCQSVYLDIYINGERRYEFLKLYIIPEQNRYDKERNTETLKLANAIKSQKIVEIQNQSYGFRSNKTCNITLTDFIDTIAAKQPDNKARRRSMNAIVYHLKKYDANGILLQQVGKNYLLGFLDYLRNAKQEHCKEEKLLHVNTQFYYFKILRYCLNYAVFEEYIEANPMKKIKSEEKPKRNQRDREYLTITELTNLARTSFYNDLLKRAFLFSCFCGLRHSDIVALTWGDLYEDGQGGMQLRIVQKKTREAILLPLSNEATKQFPQRGAAQPADRVFEGLISLGRSNEILHKWAEKAGIHKHITFHCARHTHATMLLTLGVDLYTVSKLLGHTNIQTTQIYAKIVDESKKNAIALIPNIT